MCDSTAVVPYPRRPRLKPDPLPAQLAIAFVVRARGHLFFAISIVHVIHGPHRRVDGTLWLLLGARTATAVGVGVGVVGVRIDLDQRCSRMVRAIRAIAVFGSSRCNSLGEIFTGLFVFLLLLRLLHFLGEGFVLLLQLKPERFDHLFVAAKVQQRLPSVVLVSVPSPLNLPLRLHLSVVAFAAIAQADTFCLSFGND